MRPSGLTSSVVSSSEVDLLALTHGVDLDIELEGGGANHFVTYNKAQDLTIFKELGVVAPADTMKPSTQIRFTV